MFESELDGWLRLLLPILIFLIPWLWARLKASLERRDQPIDPEKPIEPK